MTSPEEELLSGKKQSKLSRTEELCVGSNHRDLQTAACHHYFLPSMITRLTY